MMDEDAPPLLRTYPVKARYHSTPDSVHYYDPMQASNEKHLQAQHKAWKPMEKQISRLIWVFIGVVGTLTLVVIAKPAD
ncbi:hypothetical protein [Larkinella rosea]|uniref:Uncharacterized protein n=1 Tax=Larkinella rosea TaxID=2025312 RepID=A0A3P1BNJ7_9BACT|nr:hypothetical protein [Larkinella rosea]RRB02054.1 hypothetical protein EHT25_16315 [Larkinella rosea]